jgi:hypothetical protein
MSDIERISVQQAHAKTKANQALLVCAYEDEAKCRMLTRRSQRCRSGSEISRAGLYQRQGAKGRCRSVEGCGIRDELNGLQNWS